MHQKAYLPEPEASGGKDFHVVYTKDGELEYLYLTSKTYAECVSILSRLREAGYELDHYNIMDRRNGRFVSWVLEA
jgi:hypothetical protein